MLLLDAFYKTSRFKIILTQGIGGSIELNIFDIQIPGVFQQFFSVLISVFCPQMAQLWFIANLFIEHTRAPFQCSWVQFFPHSFTREGEKPFELTPTEGIDPWPPAWQASVLSITPFPLRRVSQQKLTTCFRSLKILLNLRFTNVRDEFVQRKVKAPNEVNIFGGESSLQFSWN